MIYPDGDRLLDTALANWRTSGSVPDPNMLRLERPWAEPPSPVDLHVTYHCEGETEQPDLAVTVDGQRFSLQDPVALEPVAIAKPWGQEIWYTGIEARGESRVIGPTASVSLAHYLACAPSLLCDRQQVVLLKVLDPLPEPVIGELYFEVHEHKREVYIVTHIDRRAWPDGVGYIRFGMNQLLRSNLGDAGFRAEFLEAVGAYERIRQAVDAGAEDLADVESTARERVHAFTSLKPLQLGDVVTVPTWTPHALQQGVRVVEFQTPTYERHIISFGQKVLTQARWDSTTAIAGMNLDPTAKAQFETIQSGVERIASFPDFSVWRAAIAPDTEITLPAGLPYALCMCIAGGVSLHGPNQTLTLLGEQAAFLPKTALRSAIRNPSPTQAALVLVAAPGL